MQIWPNVDENYGLTFEQLFSKFAEVYWNLILTYQIRQMPKTKGDKNSKPWLYPRAEELVGLPKVAEGMDKYGL